MPPAAKPKVLDPLEFGIRFLSANPEIGLVVADRVAHNPEVAVIGAMETLYRVHLILSCPDRVLEFLSEKGDGKDDVVARNALIRGAGVVKNLWRLYEIAVEQPAGVPA